MGAFIYLEGVTLESLCTPEGAVRANEIFAHNERILFPLLRSDRSQVDQDMGSGQPPLVCGIANTHRQEPCQP